MADASQIKSGRKKKALPLTLLGIQAFAMAHRPGKGRTEYNKASSTCH